MLSAPGARGFRQVLFRGKPLEDGLPMLALRADRKQLKAEPGSEAVETPRWLGAFPLGARLF